MLTPAHDQRPTGRPGSFPAPWRAAVLMLALAAVLLGGCRRRQEAPITKGTTVPVSLQCVWKPGHTYEVRFELDQVMDTDPPNRIADTSHRVSFEQICRIVATNTPGGQIRLDLEVLSLGMERSKSGQLSTGFDSEQGGETFDDHGYVPVLRRMVGGKMRFLVSPEGRVLKADGVSEWVERAVGGGARAAAARRLFSSNAARTVTVVTNADGTVRTNLDAAARLAVRSGGGPVVLDASETAPNAPAVRTSVASALRGFFTTDLFKQFLEFSFLPAAPVRVGDRWPAQGETPFVGRGKPGYKAEVKFTGWQRQAGTNCARLDLQGTIAQRASKSAKKDGVLQGTVWIDVESQFPALVALHKDAGFPASATAKASDTNDLSDASSPRRIQQDVGIRLLSVRPSGEAATP